MELLESPVFGRKYSVGKSGAWPKIFGWKVRCLAENIRLEYDKPTENIWFEIRKILDISGIINFGMDLTLLLLYIASATFAGSSKNVRISIGAGEF